MAITEGMMTWLKRLDTAPLGAWPSRPFLRDEVNSIPLMRQGLVEVIQPDAPYLPYAQITKAGRQAIPN